MHSFQTSRDAALPWRPLTPYEPDPRTPEIAMYANDWYQVHHRRYASSDGSPDLLHLSVKRIDQAPMILYADLLQIKDELCNPECEGIELYPARSRGVNLANQCRLWIIDSPEFRFPFGFHQRLVSDICLNGSVQQPWPPDERPADCLSERALRAILSRDPRFPAYA